MTADEADSRPNGPDRADRDEDRAGTTATTPTTSARVSRWQSALVVALVASCLAVALGVPSLFLLSIVALGFVLVGYATGPPAGDFRLERSLSDDRPRPGQPVTVSLSVTNESDRVASDVRVVDRPPADVAVIDGTPAFATAVRPGETVTYEYELAPPRGEYSFDNPTISRRNFASTVRTLEDCEPWGTRSFTCETLLDTFPLRDRTIQFVGRTPTDDGGSGVEFYATREYRRGDPINRIDWHRLARTGDLATVEYREERAVTIVFVIDDRDGIHWRSPEGGPDSSDLSLYAASRGVVASLEDGNRTGFTMLESDVWIDPGTGSGVRKRVEDAIGERDLELGAESGSGSGSRSSRGNVRTTHDGRTATDGGSPRSSDGGGRGSQLARALVHRLPSDAQVVFCTPLSDSVAVDLVRQLRSLGRVVTVVSPDMTTGVAGASVSRDDLSRPERTGDDRDRFGARIAALERANRIDECRGVGTVVVDWNLADPISVDLVRALRVAGSRRRSR